MHVPTPIRYLPVITNHIEKYFGTDFFVLHADYERPLDFRFFFAYNSRRFTTSPLLEDLWH